MTNFNMQLHGDLVSFMEECTGGFEIVRNTKTEVGLDAWRRLNHKYDPRNPLRNILEKLLAPSQVGYADVVAIMETLEQGLRVVRQRFGDDVTISGNRHTWCASRRSVRRSSQIILLCRLRPLTLLRNRD